MAPPAKKTPKAPAAPRTRKAAAAAAPAAPEAKPAKAAKAARSDDAAKAPKADKADKAKKPKLVRDSFTIPKNEYAVLEALKLRAAKLGRPAKKSEVLRAGVQALAAMGDAAFLATVGAVPTVKTGRPAKA
jgi:hypothetical protein